MESFEFLFQLLFHVILKESLVGNVNLRAIVRMEKTVIRRRDTVVVAVRMEDMG